MLMQAFDTFIGLVSVFLILSLIVSALGEGVSSALSFKGKNLKRSVRTLLDAETADAFFEHESIMRLRRDRPFFGPRLPAYVPDALVAEIIIELCVNPPSSEGGDETPEPTPISANTVNQAVIACTRSYGPALRRLWREAECDVDRFKTLVAEWFNLTGDRSVGWFRRQLSFSLFVIGFVVSAFLNADTLYMFKTLSKDAALRESFVEYSTALVDEAMETQIDCGGDSQCEILVDGFVAGTLVPDAGQQDRLAELCGQTGAYEAESCRTDLADRRDKTQQACRAVGVEGPCDLQALIGTALMDVTPLLGYDLLELQVDALRGECGDDGDERCSGSLWGESHAWWFWILKLVGWFITAAAVSLGAPFWFDLLQKIVQIRSSVKPATSAPPGTSAATKTEAAVATAPSARSVIRSAEASVESLDDLGGFDAKTYGYSPLNIYWSARLSKLAYVTETALIDAELEDWGAEGVLLDFKHSQCIVARTPQAAFLSFRGTETNVQDWLSDANVSFKDPAWDADAGYEVHSGFDKALDVIWNDEDDFVGIEATLRKMRVFEQKVPIWLSGHSLGGALAALASLRLSHVLAEKGYENIIGGVHTFGQPRVGDPGCAAAIEKLFPARYFRSINNRDIVPRVPLPGTPDIVDKLKNDGSDLKILQYRHAGKVIYFSDTGKAMLDPPMWYRKLDTLLVGTTMDEIKSAAKEAAGDHSMSGYVSLHRSLLTVAEPADDE